jgi:hypothetical protein
MKVHIIDSFPSPLYRTFEKEEDALNFIEKGVVYLRPITWYKKIEDKKRKDKDEGEGRLVVNTYRPVITLDKKTGKRISQKNEFGPVYFGTVSINPRYILCFSGPQVEKAHLVSHYGKYVVSLNQPKLLVSEIAHYIEESYLFLGVDDIWLNCIKVRYDKDQTIGHIPEPASDERTTLSYGQKNPIFSNDFEYRLVLTLPIATSSCPVEIIVDLRKKLEYVELSGF